MYLPVVGMLPLRLYDTLPPAIVHVDTEPAGAQLEKIGLGFESGRLEHLF